MKSFKKQLSINGKNDTITGEIIITMNYTTKEYNYNNPSTHETEVKSRHIHKIEGYVNSKIWCQVMDLISDGEVFKEVEKLEVKIRDHMNQLANSEKEKNFEEKIKDLGFESKNPSMIN